MRLSENIRFVYRDGSYAVRLETHSLLGADFILPELPHSLSSIIPINKTLFD
jgi:hypothetical protein